MGAEPLHSIAEEQERRRANAAASSGAPQGVGDTPAASSAAPAASAFSPRNLLGRASDWLRGIQSDDSIGTKHPTSQSRSDAPDQTVGDDEEGPDLGDTPVLDSTPNQQAIQIRSQLGPNVRENLQKLDRKRGCINRPDAPPIPEGARVAPGPVESEHEVHTLSSEKQLNIPSLAWFKLFRTSIDLSNDSEGRFDGRLFQANVKATSVITLMSNLSVITAANYERERCVGSMRMMEMRSTR